MKSIFNLAEEIIDKPIYLSLDNIEEYDENNIVKYKLHPPIYIEVALKLKYILQDIKYD
jgi:hypothetical protein